MFNMRKCFEKFLLHLGSIANKLSNSNDSRSDKRRPYRSDLRKLKLHYCITISRGFLGQTSCRISSHVGVLRICWKLWVAVHLLHRLFANLLHNKITA